LLSHQVAAEAFFGPALDASEVPVNSLLVAGWAGLIVNSLNLIPAGELDGGRISLSLWGRRTYNSLSLVTLFVLGISSLGSSLSFYWIGLVLFLQRGPLMPCQEEISKPKDEAAVTLGLGLLLLPLLILAPFPTSLFASMDQLSATSLVEPF
jgi:membrane-associated protease RseP (regulator of RpoE activity)